MAESLQVAGVRLVVEGAEAFEKDLRAANTAVSQNGAELKKLDAQYGKGSKNPEYLRQRTQLLNQQLQLQQQRTQVLRNIMEAYGKEAGATPEKLDKLRLSVTRSETAEAGFAREMREATEELEAQAAAMQEAEEATEDQTDAMDGARQTAKAMGDAIVGAGEKISKAGNKLTKFSLATVGAGFAYSAKEAVEFEDAFASVVKTVDGTDKQLEELRKGIVGLSGSGLVTQSKEEVAEVAGIAGQLAISTDNILGFSQAMLQMADATNLSSEDAATQLAQFANITGMAQDKFENLGSAIVALGNNTATQEDAIVAMGMRIAAAGRQAGMSEASIMGISAALASVGIEAEAGGTAISKVLINMDTAAAKGEKALKGYAKVAGMSAKEFKNLWNTSSEQAFTAFIQGLGRIEAEGGNVAATLEDLGYKEVRTRDALMRSALAGELVGNAIDLANSAYEENTALAEEAAKKNSTFAARMKMVKNRADNAAMGLGEALMPMLEKGLDTVDGLVTAFGALDEEERQTIVTWGGVALAAGPMIKTLGSVTSGVGHAMKGFSALKGALAGGGGWVTLAAAGLLGLSAALASIQTPLEKVQERLTNMEFDVDEKLAAKINAGIQGGIDAAQKEYTVKLAVQAEVDELGAAQTTALADGDLSRKEYKSLKKQLNEMVKSQIDEAQKELETSVTAYRATLDGLKDASGEDLFTEEEKAQLIADITSKTSSLTQQLETYQGEYDALLQTIYKQREPVTAQQMAELEALLGKIAEVRAEIKLASDEAVQVAQANYALTTSGRGSEETAGVAIGYVKGQHEQAVKGAEAARDAALAASTQLSGQEAQTAAAEKALEAYAAALGVAAQTANEHYAAILGGEAKRLGVEDELTRLAELGTALNVVEAEMAAMADMPLDAVEKNLQKLFGKGGALEGYRDKVDEWGQSMLDIVLSGEGAGPSAIKIARSAVGDVYTALLEEAAALGEREELDPLTTLFQTMFDAGAFDPEQIDLSKTEGALAGVLSLLDISGKGSEYGYDFSGNVATGMESGIEEVTGASEGVAASAETGVAGLAEAGAAAGRDFGGGVASGIKEKMLEVLKASTAMGNVAVMGLNSRGGIWAASPSRRSRQSGHWFVEGFTDEVESMEKQAQRVGRHLGSTSVESLDESLARLGAGGYRPNVAFDLPVAGDYRAMERAFTGGHTSVQEVSRADDNSVNINVGTLNTSSENDVRALAVEIGNVRRRQLAGYGAG